MSGHGKVDEAASFPQLALTPAEAAQALGCSRDFFDKHMGAPSCVGFGAGASSFVAIAEIQDWLRWNAAFTLERD